MKFKGNIISFKQKQKHWSFRIFNPEIKEQIWVNSFDLKPDFIIAGILVEVEAVQNDKGFWNLKNIKQVSESVVLKPKDEDLNETIVDTQRLIVRQSSLDKAVNFLKDKESNYKDVLALAEIFENWVFR